MFNNSNDFLTIIWLNTKHEFTTTVANYNASYMNETDLLSGLNVSSNATISESVALVAKIPITVIYIIIFISGVLGNVITCVVISRNRSMHTATNYYLFSLAISDLLVLIAGLPVEIYMIGVGVNMYPFSPAVCVIQSWVCEVSANASVLTITAFTIERYVAICKPFLSHTMSKLSRAVKFILAIWAVAVCLAIPAALELGIVNHGSHERYCTTLNSKSAANTFTISVILIFIFPMVVITILYILIGLQLRRSKIVNIRGGPSGSSVKLKHRVFKKRAQKTIVQVDLQNDVMLSFNETHNSCVNDQGTISPEDGRINFSNRATNHGTRHVVNMLVAVVVTFFFCWGLHHSQRLFAVYYSAYGLQTNSKFTENLYIVMTWLSGIFYYFSTCVNPFLYNIMSHKFRSAFKDTIAQYFYREDEQQMQPKYWYCHSLSQRSNSFHSQSLNTCSSIISTNHYQQQPLNHLRYKEIDLMKLKRPLVVSFRKIPCATMLTNNSSFESGSSNQITEIELQQDYTHMLDSLRVSETLIANSKSISENDGDEKADNNKNYNRQKSSHKLITWFDSKHNRKDKMNGRTLTRSTLHNSSVSMVNGYLSASCRKTQFLPTQKKLYNSPYNSPEMTYDSKKLEENLNIILKQLVFKNEIINGHFKHNGSRTTVASISKSKSVPCFSTNS